MIPSIKTHFITASIGLSLAFPGIAKANDILPNQNLLPMAKVIEQEGGKKENTTPVLTANLLLDTLKQQDNTADILPDLTKLSKGTVNAFSIESLPVDQDSYFGISTYFSHVHPGLDLRAKFGSPVRSILPGVVREVGFEAYGYGKYVIVAHQNGEKTVYILYAHLKTILAKAGQEVSTLSQIGEIGLTGHTTGPHLHLEVHQDDKAIDPIKLIKLNPSIALAKK